jgi:2-amino-4-hydroxy-6-hydroxymethyldihydropteridine diphosphokinase
MPHDFVVGLGGNLGDRGQVLARSVERILRIPGLKLRALSRVFETEPIGPPQPRYLNAAVRISYDDPADALLGELLAIETQLGRTRELHWGPRTIDLDILWGSEVASSARLTIPHAQLCERAFALVPLLEVAPELAAHYGPALARLGAEPVFHGWFELDAMTGGCAYFERADV